MLQERIESPVAVQQRHPFDNAPRRGQRVDPLAHRHAQPAQRPVMPRRRDREIVAADNDQLQFLHQAQRGIEIALRAEALQHLRHEQDAGASATVALSLPPQILI